MCVTIDPVVFRDICADVVLVRWRAKGTCERCVFAQEVRGCASIQVLIWNNYRSINYDIKILQALLSFIFWTIPGNTCTIKDVITRQN